MKIRLLAFILIVFNIHLYSQERIIDLDDIEIKLDTYKIFIDTIVDVREEKDCVGYVYKGISTNPTPAYLKQNFINFLEESLISDNNTENEGDHLILRVNRLFIYEQIYVGAEYSMIDLNVSFIIKKQGKYYEKYQASAFLMNSAAIDASIQHKKNIKEALEYCLKQYIERSKLNIFKDENVFQETDLYENPLKEQKYRILSISKYKKGLYRTFADFRDYTIDSLSRFTINYKTGNNNSKIATITSIDNSKIKEIWGFSDGDQNYVRINNKYYSLNSENNTFTVYDYPPDFQSRINMAGMIGGLFLTTLTYATTKKIKYSIDLSSGRFYPSDSPPDLKTESRIIVLYSKYSKNDDEIELYANNINHGVLKKGTYKVLNFGSDIKSVDLTIKTNGLNKSQIINPILFNTELFLIKFKKDKITINETPKNLRDVIIKDIKEGHYTKIE